MKCLPGIPLWRSCILCFHSRALIQPSLRPCIRFLVESQSKNRHAPYSCHAFQPRRCCSHGVGTLWHNVTLQNYVLSLLKEHEQLGEILSHTLKEEERKAVSMRHSELSPLCSVLHQIQEAENEVKELDAMCADLNSRAEEQLLSLALEEKEAMNHNISQLCTKLLNLLVPQEKYDMNDAILEVVSGRTTGGDICQQFTSEVFDMYQKYAHYKSWSFEIMNYTAADYGGLHHAAARIAGEGVYKRLKYEGGVHRVQRIPQVGLSSRMQRIHTGTMTVIVLPQPDEIEIRIDPKDLRIDTFRAKGAGGQHVNTTDSAVRIVYLPTGMSVECQQERSQIHNRETAMRMLRAKLFEQNLSQELSQRQSARKLQVGTSDSVSVTDRSGLRVLSSRSATSQFSGDAALSIISGRRHLAHQSFCVASERPRAGRLQPLVGTRDQSDRIRTYNFTQDRLTDHRISYESRNLKEFLNGEELLDDLIEKLQQSADAEALLEVIENNSLKLNR